MTAPTLAQTIEQAQRELDRPALKPARTGMPPSVHPVRR